MSFHRLWIPFLLGATLLHVAWGEKEEADVREETDDPVSEILGRSELLEKDSEQLKEAQKAAEEKKETAPANPEIDETLPSEAGAASSVLLPKPNADAGPGELDGVVYDRQGKGIPGAILTFPTLGGLQLRTDELGTFSLMGVPAGEVPVEILKPTYQTKITLFKVKPEGMTKVQVNMEIKPVELAEGEYLLEGREVILDYQEDAFGGVMLGDEAGGSFMSGIGKDDFVKQALSNAADAVGRVSGANIVDGKYAVVRGLADRYVTTSFNNGAITSADPSRKTVQLDLFPTSVIEGIGVEKIYRPSMPGDFGGGAINIRTLAMPEERFIKLGYRIGYNSNLDSPFYRNPDRGLGFLGDVDNPIPRDEIFDVSGNFPGGSGNSNPDPAAEAAWDRLLGGTALVGRASQPRPSHKFGLAYGDNFELENGMRLGVLASFSHSTQDRMQVGRERSRPGIERSWLQDDYSSEVDWGLFLSAQLEINDRHSIRGTYFRKHVAEDRLSLQREISDAANGIRFGVQATNAVRDGLPAIDGVRPAIPGFGADAYYKGEVWQTDTTIRDLELMQLAGEHELWEDGLKVSWGLTRNESSESRPYSTAFRYGVLDFADPRLQVTGDPLVGAAGELNAAFGLGLDSPSFDQVADEMRARMLLGAGLDAFLETIKQAALDSQPVYDPSLGQVRTLGNVEYTGDSPGQLVSEILNQRISEITIERYVDTEMPFYLGNYFGEDMELRVQAGFRSAKKTRSSRGQSYRIDANDLPDEFLYGPDSFGTNAPLDPSILVDGTNGGTNGITVEDGNAFEVRNFDGNSSLLGLYLSGEIDWGTFTLGGGLRHEEETRGFVTLPAPLNLSTVADKSGEVTNETNIPSLFVKKSFDDDRFRVGAYFSRTVARPTFYEFLPARTVEQDTGFERRGDFDLKDTTITNFDLTFEWDVTDDSRITVAPFYKHLEDPIISVVRRSQRFIGFQNAEEGTLQGVEVEFDIGEFAPFTLKGNYTYIDAELIAEINTGVNGFQPVSLQYPNQPEHILNLAFGYEHEDSGWSGNLVYNFIGENALFLRIKEGDANVLSPAVHTLDFNLRKRMEFENMDFTLSFGMKNILDTKTRVFFDGGGTSFEDEIFDIQNSGRSFFLEGKIEF